MIRYHRCPGCKSIFTEQDISNVIVTENDNPEDRNNRYRFQQVLDRVAPLNGAYMDFGCGTGEFVAWLNKHVESCRAVGIDKNTGLKVSDFVDGWLGGVFMIEVIEHLDDPLSTLRELLEKVKPGGFIYIESTFADSIPDHTNHPYVKPEIGHKTILSRKCFNGIKGVSVQWINANVLVLRKSNE